MTGTTDETNSTGPGMPDLTTTVDWFAHPDPYLQTLADYGNAGIGVAVTLFMPWGMVVGSIISAPAYFTQSAERLREAARGTDQEAMVNKFVELGVTPASEELAKGIADESSQVHQGYGTTSHIQLAPAVALISGQVVNIPQIRLKLSSVTGWSYGKVHLGG